MKFYYCSLILTWWILLSLFNLKLVAWKDHNRLDQIDLHVVGSGRQPPLQPIPPQLQETAGALYVHALRARPHQTPLRHCHRLSGLEERSRRPAHLPRENKSARTRDQNVKDLDWATVASSRCEHVGHIDGICVGHQGAHVSWSERGHDGERVPAT